MSKNIFYNGRQTDISGAALILNFHDKEKMGSPIRIAVGRESQFLSDFFVAESVEGSKLQRLGRWRVPDDFCTVNTNDIMLAAKKHFSDLTCRMNTTLKHVMQKPLKPLQSHGQCNDDDDLVKFGIIIQIFQTHPELSAIARNDPNAKHQNLIQYDTPEFELDPITKKSYLAVKFRLLTARAKYGVVKGGVKSEVDKNSRDTIIREVGEELGIQLKDNQLEFIGNVVHDGRRNGAARPYSVFTVTLESTEIKKKINPTIHQRIERCYGELFDVHYQFLNNLVNKDGTPTELLLKEYNNLSKNAILAFWKSQSRHSHIKVVNPAIIAVEKIVC